jgi:hypothetical protein
MYLGKLMAARLPGFECRDSTAVDDFACARDE